MDASRYWAGDLPHTDRQQKRQILLVGTALQVIFPQRTIPSEFPFKVQLTRCVYYRMHDA